jgi:superfamily II DNA or RNA helicase
MITRYSSRIENIGQSFLNEKLKDAIHYDRIAGYFSSSLLEIAGEAIENIKGNVRIICNSDLDIRDIETARAAQIAQRREWCREVEDIMSDKSQQRFMRLYNLLKSGKMQVRVLSNDVFGLIHGKAGVITLKDGKQLAFMGSANESYSAWKLNYEIVWEDATPEAIQWVQNEFNSLWNHEKVKPLAEFVVEDIGRIAHRKIIAIDRWKENADGAASAIVEAPVYRKEYGLWAHQKYFVKLAFDEHTKGNGARFVLADQVGLGKTIQLALAAQLMALIGDKPVLIIVPKTLLWQWQEEMKSLLNMPSAVWDGRRWIDEAGLEYPVTGVEGLRKCPRKTGIISQGLIVRGGKALEEILKINYECVVVDECHRARRKNLKPDGENEAPDPNNLLKFLWDVSTKTKSLLLATATPVQLYPIEAYDLLYALSIGNNYVLGNEFSKWRGDKRKLLEYVQKIEEAPSDLDVIWDWSRNPLPPDYEDDRVYGSIRRRLSMERKDVVATGDKLKELQPQDKQRLINNKEKFFVSHNPFIRHIIRRTRDFLENTIDPETNEPYLQKVNVELFGETEEEAIILPTYLHDAYQTAENFCEVLGERMQSSGFMRTMLLRRIGSSLEAGKKTAIRMLSNLDEQDKIEQEEEDIAEETLFDEENIPDADYDAMTGKNLSASERGLLNKLIKELEAYQDTDPKYYKLKEFIIERNWKQLGCIIFSQYFDTVEYMASLLSRELPDEDIGIYAGSNKSCIWKNSEYTRTTKEEIKKRVQRNELKILFGTDAASEGLNLQRLGTLINLDLPWNPTKLEQRKGRIQRIGQIRETVFVYNMRYKGSVEDRVHQLLSERLSHVFNLFGQIPDVLKDVWIDLAIGNKEAANRVIGMIPEEHSFEAKYNQIENIDFESCAVVLNELDIRDKLKEGWS